MKNDMDIYLQPTFYFDFETQAIRDIVKTTVQATWSDKRKAIALYLKIRDGWWYDPYQLSFETENWKASKIVLREKGHCIDKSTLLISCLRAIGIPARLQLAKVKNHIAVERLIAKMGTNELTPHGMVSLFLNGKWLKVSPAFNRELCEKCQVDPLDFDGEQSAVFQEYNREGKAFMEYLEDYGHFEDLPIDFIIENIKQHYPQVLFGT